MRALRIGIDAAVLTKLSGGVSYYVFYLLEELIRQKRESHFFLYTPSAKGDIEYFKQFDNVTICAIPYLTYKKTIWRNVLLPFFVRRDKIDLFWETIYIFRFLMPKQMKMLLTVYDFVAYLFPETMTLRYAFYHRCVTRHALKRADFIFSISEGTKKRLKEMFDLEVHEVVLPPHKPQVIYKNREITLPFLTQLGLEYNNYLVTVGTWEPRKNFLFLLQIYECALEVYGPEKVMPLVVVGGGGWKNAQIQRSFQTLQNKYPSHLKIAGYVSDEKLSFYLSGARYYVCLSLYEGYGMPIAEARHCHTPIICLDTPEMREAAEDDGFFFSQEEMKSKLPELMLKGKPDSREKPPLKLNYPTNAQSAALMAAALKIS